MNFISNQDVYKRQQMILRVWVALAVLPLALWEVNRWAEREKLQTHLLTLSRGGAPDSLVRHRTVTVDGPVPISFLFWRGPHIARGLRGRPLAHRTVLWIIAVRRQTFPESGLFTGDQPGAPDSPVCQTELSFGCTQPVSCNPFLFFFSLFLTLRQTY